MPYKSFIEKLRSENDIMTASLEANRNVQAYDNSSLSFVQDTTAKIGNESKSLIDRFWSDDTALNDELFESAKRFHIDVDLKKTQDEYASEKELAQKKLADLSKLDSSRTNKSRTGHMEKASAAYKKAAQLRTRMSKNKSEGKTYTAVLDAEESIRQIIEGEREIIKATGTKNMSEAYELARLDVKEASMLFNLYTSALRQAAFTNMLSTDDEEILQARISKAEALMAEKNRKFETLLAYRQSKIIILTDGSRIMESGQIKKYMDTYGITDNSLVEKLNELLDNYHGLDPKYKEERIEILTKITLYLESDEAQHINDRKEMQTLITILQKQITSIHDKGKTSLDEEMDSYEEITDQELEQTALEHRKYLTEKDIYDAYGTYRGNRLHETHGYFLTAQGLAMYDYLKDKDEYAKNFWKNYQKLIDDAKVDYNLPEDELQEYITELKNSYKNHLEGKEKTIKALEKCLENGKMKGRKKVRRVVNGNFLQDKLGICLNDINGQIKDQEKLVAEANKHYGTIISNHQFTSTANKVDDMWFANNNPKIMLTMLCEDGQKCFFSENFKEGEILLPRGVRYVLVGAKSHKENAIKLPTTDATFSEDGSQVTFAQKSMDFDGIELIVKVIKEDNIQQKSSVQKDDMKETHEHLNNKGREHAQKLLDENSKKDSALMIDVKKNLRTLENTLKKSFPKNNDELENYCNSVTKNYIDAIRACYNYLKNKNPHSDDGNKRYKLVSDQRKVLIREKEIFIYGAEAIRLNFADAPNKTSDVLNIGRDVERRIKHISPESMEDYTYKSIEEGLSLVNDSAAEGEEKLKSVETSVKLQEVIANQFKNQSVRIQFKIARDRAEKAAKELGLDSYKAFYCIYDDNYEKLESAHARLVAARNAGATEGIIGQRAYSEFIKYLKTVDSYRYLMSFMYSNDENLKNEIKNAKTMYQKVIDRADRQLKKYENILLKLSIGARLTNDESGALKTKEEIITEYQNKSDPFKYTEETVEPLDTFANDYREELTQEEREAEIEKDGTELNFKEGQAKRLETVINNQRGSKMEKLRAAVIKGNVSMKEQEAKYLMEFLGEDEDANAELLKNYSESEDKRLIVMSRIYDEFINTDFMSITFNKIEDGINNADKLERVTNRFNAMQKLFRANQGIMQRMFDKHARENAGKFAEAERASKIKTYIDDANKFFVKKMREANNVCLAYRLLRDVITDPYYRKHRSSEISKLYDCDNSAKQNTLSFKLNLLAQCLNIEYTELNKYSFTKDKEKYQGKLYFPAQLVQDGAGREYNKNTILVQGTKHEQIFMEFKKNEPERFEKLFTKNYKIEGDTDQSTEFIGRTMGVVANLAAIQEMEPEALKSMLMKLSETAKSTVKGQIPSAQDIEAAKQKNIEGLKEYKEVIKKQIRYLKKKYGLGYIFADPRVLAAHINEIQRDFCFITDTAAIVKYMYRTPGIIDLDDPEEKELLSEMNYYQYIGVSYMFTFRNLENPDDSDEHSYTNVMKYLSTYMQQNLLSFDVELSMQLMDHLEQPQQDILWNTLEEGEQAPEPIEGDIEQYELKRQKDKDWNDETGLNALDKLSKAKDKRANVDILISQYKNNIIIEEQIIKESKEKGDEKRVNLGIEYIKKREKDIEDSTNTIPELDKLIEDAQKEYNEIIAKFESKYGHKPTSEDFYKNTRDKSDYKKIFSELEAPKKDAVLTPEQLLQKLSA